MLVIGIIIAEVLLSLLLNNFISSTILEYSFILLNIFIVIYYIAKNILNDKVMYMLVAFLLIRIGLVFVDIHLFTLPMGGMDTNSFHNTAVNIATVFPHSYSQPYGMYAEVLGVIYYCFGGEARVFSQSINAILFILVVVNVYKTLEIFGVNKNSLTITAGILLLMPVGIFETSILLRESMIIWSLSQSIYLFSKWLYNKKSLNIVLAIIFNLIAAQFHSGVILLSAVYAVVLVQYSFNYQVKFNYKLIVLLAAGVIVLGVIDISYYIDKIAVYDQFLGDAGSAYLTGIKPTNLLELIVFTPIKLVYFLFSPMPWDWRGLGDIVTFFTDSIVYILLMLPILKFKQLKKDQKNLVSIFYWLFFCTAIPYSLGTVAAGTALRHRFKVFFILLIAYSLFQHFIKLNKEEKHENITCN